MKYLFLLGDSTCAKKTEEVKPETGWGEVFSRYVARGYWLANCASNGCSSEKVLLQRDFYRCFYALSEGDYVFIQFGHNETKSEFFRRTEPFTSYKANLTFMVKNLKKKGVNVVLISPIARRNFVNGVYVETHGDYPIAMEQVAREQGVPFIDMTKISREYLISIGDKHSLMFYMNFRKDIYPNYKDGCSDNTHFTIEGAELYARMIYLECRKLKLKCVY